MRKKQEPQHSQITHCQMSATQFTYRDIIEATYVINLEHSTERREHVSEVFRKIGQTNFQFFKAVNGDSDEVAKLMQSGFVASFPPCFRCGMNVCGCQNNVLIEQQVGNWLSFIGVMKQIVAKDYQKLVMICEDDVQFTRDYHKIMGRLITPKTFAEHSISLEAPLLIRLEQRGRFPRFKRIKLVDKSYQSNACFLVNKGFAAAFLRNLKTIDRTSDNYIHRRLVTLDSSIQHFSARPAPAYQLSGGYGRMMNLKGRFHSEIHPKNIDAYDEDRNRHHIKKIYYKKFLCIGHPRCGTEFVANLLTSFGHQVGHERMAQDGVSSWMLAVKSESYPFGTIGHDKNDPFTQYYFENVIHIVRDPFRAIPSIINENKYSPENRSYSFRKQHLESSFDVTLPHIPKDDVEKLNLTEEIEAALTSFLYWNELCEKSHPNLTVKVEDAVEKLQQYNPDDIREPELSQHSNKPYQGKIYEKNTLTPEDLSKVDPKLLEKLRAFCATHNYPCLL